MYIGEKFVCFLPVIFFHSLSVSPEIFDFDQTPLKLTDCYFEGHKMVGNRQNHFFF